MNIFATKKAIAELAFRLGEVSVEVRELKTAHKHLELEWEELYDKVRHQMARMSRRAKVDPKNDAGGLDLEPEGAQAASIDPISHSIMLRRAGVRREK